ncbi:MAG: hypothetical protein JNK78_01280 [Planctomycetes bacterium]|nr:hypothetical protein [Planctomycetota bacterium]
MHLADVVPFVWCAVAIVAVARSRRGGRLWWVTCTFAAMLATLHRWGWNKPLYHAGRATLIDFGVYDDRLVFKAAIGVVFAALCAWFAWRMRRWPRRLLPLHRIGWLAMLADALYVAVRTLSIDGWMPIAIGVEPGKSVLGLSLAIATLLAFAFAHGPAPEIDDDAL